MWYALLGIAFVVGIFFGGRWCHMRYKANQAASHVVTLKPERDEFRSLVGDLKNISGDLKVTARLLAEDRAIRRLDDDQIGPDVSER